MGFYPDRTGQRSKGMEDNGKGENEVSGRLRKLSWIGKEVEIGFDEVKKTGLVGTKVR